MSKSSLSLFLFLFKQEGIMFKVKNILKLCFALIFVLLLFAVDVYANDITKLEKVIEISEITTEEFKKLHVIWDFDEKTNIDSISITNAKGNILFQKKRHLLVGEKILERKILEERNGLIFEEKYVVLKDKKSPNDLSLKVLRRLVEKVAYDNLIIYKKDWFKENQYSIVLIDPRGYVIDEKPPHYGYLPPPYIVLGNIDNENILRFGNMKMSPIFEMTRGNVRNFCLLEPPLLHFDFLPFEHEDDMRMFNFLTSKKEMWVSDHYNSWEEETVLTSYRWYVELLKKILFNFDIDDMIKSGKYKGKDLEMLSFCKKEGIITDIDSVIMWTAFKTEDVGYIENTYNELKKYEKRKPKYLLKEYGLDELLGLKGTTIKEIINNLKKLRGGK